MRYILPKRSLAAIFRPHMMWLFTALLFGTTTASALEETSNTTGGVPYHSAFEDYRTISKDTLTDWKTINQSSEGSGHSGHQMQGMQHDMPTVESKSAESGMDHSSMGHGMGTHNDVKMDSAVNRKMDHDMTNMNHQNMSQDMPAEKSSTISISNSNANPDMSAMDHSKMTHMQHQHGADDSSMANMDYSQMESMPQPSNSVESSDTEVAPHKHASDSPMQGHDMTKSIPSTGEMSGNSATTAQATNKSFSIIPNLHPAVVHFPIALTLIALLFSFGAHMLRKHSAVPLLAAAGHFTLWFAALSAVVAAILGWLAFNSGMNHDDAGHAAMLLHRQWAIPTAIGLVALAGWDAWKARINQVMSFPALTALIVLSGAIATTAWLGGEIVYRHGIGVLSLPSTKVAGHSHEHNGANAAEHSDGTAMPNEHAGHQHDATQGVSHEH